MVVDSLVTTTTPHDYRPNLSITLDCFAHLTHKNPQYFPNPEEFDLSRFGGNGPPPYTFVPFGAGPRMCPGNEYSRLEIHVFIHKVVTKFRWETLLRPSQGLPIRLHPHHKP
ncbi:hypothetical protein HYC85_002570 [Camellia sinensis]|uniref:Cytochrome P450 n=1 Tax=Camellia sinensis TaxID=4442 RepID=A0A7J7I9V7_CAMSI|nr:hypothetical protein HYC85_002570 [Camellia sinensis]